MNQELFSTQYDAGFDASTLTLDGTETVLLKVKFSDAEKDEKYVSITLDDLKVFFSA